MGLGWESMEFLLSFGGFWGGGDGSQRSSLSQRKAPGFGSPFEKETGSFSRFRPAPSTPERIFSPTRAENGGGRLAFLHAPRLPSRLLPFQSIRRSLPFFRGLQRWTSPGRVGFVAIDRVTSTTKNEHHVGMGRCACVGRCTAQRKARDGRMERADRATTTPRARATGTERHHHARNGKKKTCPRCRASGARRNDGKERRREREVVVRAAASKEPRSGCDDATGTTPRTRRTWRWIWERRRTELRQLRWR